MLKRSPFQFSPGTLVLKLYSGATWVWTTTVGVVDRGWRDRGWLCSWSAFNMPFCHGNETKESRPQPQWLLSYNNVAYFLWFYCKGISCIYDHYKHNYCCFIACVTRRSSWGWLGCNFLFLVGMMGHWERVCRRQLLWEIYASTRNPFMVCTNRRDDNRGKFPFPNTSTPWV